MKPKAETGNMRTAWKIALPLLALASVFAALCIGRMAISPYEVLRSAAARLSGGQALDDTVETVLWRIRLPRVLLAALCGAGLSVAGCVFQSLFANPLATPDTLGVASGAGFGAVLGLLLGLPLLGGQGISLAFGVLAVVLTGLSGTGRGRGLNGVVLAGIMIGSLFTALISLVKFTADTETQLPSITYWLMGSLGAAGYNTLLLGAPPVLLGVLILFLLRWRLNLLPLGEEEAAVSGVNIPRLRAVTVLCATAITASCVSMCGQVGWVGLLVPHFCRMLFGSDHRALLPSCVLLGAAFLTAVDTAARSVSAAEIPISVLTAIIGAPFFIVLMRRSGRWTL